MDERMDGENKREEKLNTDEPKMERNWENVFGCCVPSAFPVRYLFPCPAFVQSELVQCVNLLNI